MNKLIMSRSRVNYKIEPIILLLDLDNTIIGDIGAQVDEYFLIKSIKEPSKINSIYAISCPDGGDKFGSIENPSTYFIEIATNTMVYANKFPEYENSDFIIKKYKITFNNKYRDHLLRSEPSELFTLHPMLITK